MLIEREAATACFSIVPRVLDAVLDEFEQRPRRLSLRVLLTCGEVLTATVARRARSILACELVNQYGPTEATMVATFHRVRAADLEGAWIPIGREIGSMDVRVVDRSGVPVPAGTAGD